MKKLLYKAIEKLYSYGLKPILFRIDPEKVHDAFIVMGRTIGGGRIGRWTSKQLFCYENAKLTQELLGVSFNNPVGLAAGFDKDAYLPRMLESVGFGFVEVGSITAHAYVGNEGLRLKRYPQQKSIWVYYGLKNEGVDVIAKRIKQTVCNMHVGISIAKTNCKETTDVHDGVEDYLYSLRVCKEQDIGDYFTLNLSCPNAHGGESFLDPENLQALLREVQSLRIQKPIFVKLANAISDKQLYAIVDVCQKYGVSGYVCSNLKKKQGEKGGWSGKPTESGSNAMIEKIYRYTRGKACIIGVGGIFSAQDAYEKIKSGASLVQLITGMIYQGPQIIAQINQGLVELLEKDGYTNITEAIGAYHEKNREV